MQYISAHNTSESYLLQEPPLAAGEGGGGDPQKLGGQTSFQQAPTPGWHDPRKGGGWV